MPSPDTSDSLNAARNVEQVEVEPATALDATAWALLRAGDSRTALNCFREMLKINPFDSRAFKGLGYSFDLLGRKDDALYWYMKYKEANMQIPEAHSDVIRAMLEAGQAERAASAAKQACSLFPGTPRFRYLVGRSHYELGDLETALSATKDAIEHEPATAEFWCFLGLVWETLGDLEEALKAYSRAEEIDPRNGETVLGKAGVLRDLGRNAEYLEATSTARRVYEQSGNRAGLVNAYWEEGWAYYVLRRWRESADASAKAVELKGELAPPRFNLGLALMRCGETERAKREYLAAAELGDIGSLKTDGINDLEAALADDPALEGASEILEVLKGRYLSLAKERDEKVRMLRRRGRLVKKRRR